MKWTSEEHNHLLELVQKHGTQWKYIAQLMTEKYGKRFRAEQCRARFRMYPEKEWPIEYKETVEILPDGSHKSDKLLRMTAEQAKDPEYLLQAHGYDKNEWELISARSNIWNVYSKQDGIQVLYSSKITVKPKKQAFDEYVLERIINRLPKIKIPKAKSKQDEEAPYLNIPLFDMHFGISDYEYYKPTQARILHFLEKPRKDVLFIIGQDLFHNNDFQGHTASGRTIERVEMEKAFEDAWKFYVPLIEAAIENSEQVHVFYSIGNHDEFAGWAFVKALEKRYSDQAVFDTRFKERKVHMLGKNFVGMNHSDKKKAIRLSENFSTEFPLEWSQATTRTIYVGHEHKEEVVQTVNDEGGVVIRRMPTGNKVDSWHDSMGFTTSHKRFEIQEYSETKLEAIYYV